MIAFSAAHVPTTSLATIAGPRAHLIGAAGAGMRALASVLLARGWQLTGSDHDLSSSAWLNRAGMTVDGGHSVGRLARDQQLVIYSDAIPAGNVERREALRRGIRQLSYPQAVGELMAESRGLAVAGTHGKSTTTAMIAQVMETAGLDPTTICGATPRGATSGGRAGTSEWLVAEACEYRANFLAMRPEVALVLNIEHDHFDYYRSHGEVEQAFRRFVAQVPTEGAIVATADCPTTSRVLDNARCRVVTFGHSAAADWQAAEIDQAVGRHRFTLLHHRKPIGQVKLQVPGRHQIANALAAAAACRTLGVAVEDICRGLETFAGLQRRLEQLGEQNCIEFWDDYAHHPTEIRAALSAMRMMYPGRRLWCVFQPHQVSRTVALVDEFAASLQNADCVAVADVFAARENVTHESRSVAENLARRTSVLGVEVLAERTIENISASVRADARPGDVVITLGAGDIRKRFYERTDRI